MSKSLGSKEMGSQIDLIPVPPVKHTLEVAVGRLVSREEIDALELKDNDPGSGVIIQAASSTFPELQKGDIITSVIAKDQSFERSQELWIEIKGKADLDQVLTSMILVALHVTRPLEAEGTHRLIGRVGAADEETSAVWPPPHTTTEQRD